jgi:NAD(P)H dehydrogenase (quinone)
MQPKILITLATGKTGYASTLQLLSEGYTVRIYVRSKNEKALALEKLGAEIALGDLGNKPQLQKALEGIQNVYYCYPYRSGMAKDVSLFIEAATEANIHAVVFMGQRIAEFDDTGSAMTADVRKSYELLKNSGLNVVYFAPGYFADNVFVITEFVLQLGLMPNPFGNGKNPWISIDDMARCIVALLKNPAPYFGQKLFPTGNKSISPKEMVNIFSKIRGKKVRKVNIPDWLFFKAGIMTGLDFGFDKFAIVQATFYNRQMQINRFDIEPTDIVKKLTGREPEDFETITRQYFDNSPFKRRTFYTWLTTFIKFNKMPFTKVPSKKERMEINK